MNVVQKPNMNLGLWASNGNYSEPDSDKVELGWVVEKPLKETMNWVQNRQDTMLQYLNQHGIAEWDSLTTYPVDAFVARNGVVFKAISQNIDKDPTSNVEIWKVAFSTFQDFDDLKKDVEKIKTVDGYLSKYVKKSEPVMDGVSKGVGYAGQDLTQGLFFNSEQKPVMKSNSQEYVFRGNNSSDYVYQEDDVIRFGDLKSILENYTRYRVGDLYFTTSSVNPKNTLGYGEWILHGQGRAIVGLSDVASQSPDWSKYVGGTFGSYEHTLTVDEMPSHNHQVTNVANDDSGKGYFTNGSYNGTESDSLVVNSTGGNKPHNNVQPSVVVAIWLRVS